MDRQNIRSGTAWEREIGYSRAVKIGAYIHVSGTTSMTNGTLIGVDNVYKQTLQTIKNIETALEEAGSSLTDVVRTRIFVTDIDQWENVGRAHGEYFQNIRPASTMVEVNRLIAPELLVEIEADAYIGE